MSVMQCKTCGKSLGENHTDGCHGAGMPVGMMDCDMMVHPREFGRTSFTSGAVRDKDADSTRYDLVSPVGLRRLAETYAEGATKYGDRNWEKGIPASNLLNHLMKHIEQWRDGDRTEDHLAHAAWGIFALLHFSEKMPEMMQE